MRRFLFILVCVLLSWGPLFAVPKVIAHRGGGCNFPENTLLAFEKAIEGGVHGIELDVQVTQDGVVVVYHPADLSLRTNGSGSIASKTFAEISSLDAAYTFMPEQGYPFRGQGLGIPSLKDVLKRFPNTLIIIDLKSRDYETLLKCISQMIPQQSVKNLVFYSTNSAPIDWIERHFPNWKTFERRDRTRLRLLELNQGQAMSYNIENDWLGFEVYRPMEVKETFALGEGRSQVLFHLWTEKVVSVLKGSFPHSQLVLFGINTKEDWEEAVRLNVDFVYTDAPVQILTFASEVDSKK